MVSSNQKSKAKSYPIPGWGRYRVTMVVLDKLSIQGLCNNHTGPESRVSPKPPWSPCTYSKLIDRGLSKWPAPSVANHLGNPVQSTYEISWPLEYHTFPSSLLYVVPVIFKPVFICVHSKHADKIWLENERSHIQGSRKYLNMLLLRSRNYMPGCQVPGKVANKSCQVAKLHFTWNM